MAIGLKELRETYIWLQIIELRFLIKPITRLDYILKECNELISIFASSISTTNKNIFFAYTIM
jgi:hypothetical protein